jgi:hypothetical protein
MSSSNAGRSYLVTPHGTLERVVQKRMAGKQVGKDEEHELKVIFPKTSSESIQHKMLYRGKHKQVEPITSLHMRDHVEAQSKHYELPTDRNMQKCSFSLSRWM